MSAADLVSTNSYGLALSRPDSFWVAVWRSFSGLGVELWHRGISPRLEIVAAALGMAVDDAGNHVGGKAEPDLHLAAGDGDGGDGARADREASGRFPLRRRRVGGDGAIGAAAGSVQRSLKRADG